MKDCIRCNVNKPLNQFYKHGRMADGHFNKCKECFKEDTKKLRETKSEDNDWVIQERERCRKRNKRLGYGKKYKPSTEVKALSMEKYKAKYPEKIKAQFHAQKLDKKKKENHLHHWSYNEEYFKDCIELSVKDHFKLHRFIDYDKEMKCYRDSEGNLLDTKKKHLEYAETLNIIPF